MTDDAGKSGKPRFEPPPWERDAFDELARRREAEEAAERATAEARRRAAEAAAAEAAESAAAPDRDAAYARWAQQAREARGEVPVPGAAPAPAPVREAERPAEPVAPVAEAPEPEAQAAAAPRTAAPEPAALDERQVSRMLIELKADEPQVHHAIRPAATAASAITGIVGLLVAGIGVASLKGTSGNMLAMGSAGITVMLGAMFIGTAVWIWVRATRGKGR